MSTLENKIRALSSAAAARMQENKGAQNNLLPTLILRKSSDKKSIDLKLSIHYRLTNLEADKIASVVENSSSFDKEIEKVIERKKIQDFKTITSYSVELHSGYETLENIPIPVENFSDIKFNRNDKLITCSTEKIRISQIPSVTKDNESFAFKIKKHNSSSAMSGMDSVIIHEGTVLLKEPNVPTNISQSAPSPQAVTDVPIVGDLHAEVMRDSVIGFFTVDNRILKQGYFELRMRTGQSAEQKSIRINNLSAVPNVTKDENLTMYKFNAPVSGSKIIFSINYNHFSSDNKVKENIAELEQHVIDLGKNPSSYVNNLNLLRDLDNTYKKTREIIENKKENTALFEEVIGAKKDKIRILDDVKKYFSDASEFIKNANFMKTGEDGKVVNNIPSHVYSEIELGSITALYKPTYKEKFFENTSYTLEDFQATIRKNFVDSNKNSLVPHYAKTSIESRDLQDTKILRETQRTVVSLNQEKKNRGAAYLLVGYAKAGQKKSGILLKKPIWKPALDDDFERGTYLAKVSIINPDGNLYEQYLTVTVRKE